MGTDEPSSPSLHGKLSTSIVAKLRGDDPGVLVLGLIFLLLTLGALGFESQSPNIFSEICILVGLSGLLTILFRWYRQGQNLLKSEGIPIDVGICDKEVTVKTIVRNPREAIALLRATIQGRGDIPPPRGTVNGNPQQLDALREYTDEERERITAELRKNVARHDKVVLRQLDEIERQIPPPEAHEHLGIPDQKE